MLKYENGKINDGIEFTSIWGYAMEIDIEWSGEISPRLLVGKDISVSESLQKIELEGLNKDVNTVLFTLNYQSRQDWNSELYGLEQVAIRATDGILETTGTINIHVRALNDPPAISLGNSAFVTQEDNALMLINASVEDVDADESDDNYITVKMSAVYGRLTLMYFLAYCNLATPL